MYKILSDQNKVLGYVDTPSYIKLKNGNITPCVPVEATGVSYGGTVYNLLGHHDWPDSPTAFPSLVTDGEMLAIINAKTTETVDSVKILLGEA